MRLTYCIVYPGRGTLSFSRFLISQKTGLHPFAIVLVDGHLSSYPRLPKNPKLQNVCNSLNAHEVWITNGLDIDRYNLNILLKNINSANIPELFCSVTPRENHITSDFKVCFSV